MAEEREGGLNPEKSLMVMAKTGPLLAQARGELTYMEEFRKSKKALLMKAAEVAGHTASNAQEREAYADEGYVEHLVALQAATEKYEALRWKMVTAQAAIDVWRSQEASNRGMDRGAA